MGYIERNLANDEQIMARIKHSWAGLVSTALGVLFFSAIGIVFFKLIDILNKIGEKIGEEKIPDSDARIINAFMIVFGLIFIFLALVLFLGAIVEIKSAQLVVTNKRVFGRRGLISKFTTDIMLSKIDTINVNNGFFGAIFHYGTIEIVSGASMGMTKMQRATLRYAYISNTEEFRKAVLETIEEVREEERVAQARSLSDAMKKD